MTMLTIDTIRQVARRTSVRLSFAFLVALILAGRGSGRVTVLAQSGCAANPVAAENCLAGDSDWDLTGGNDPTIQGFASDISVDVGQPVNFKISTDATTYRIDVYRLGYYGNRGARKVATQTITLGQPQVQPDCMTDPTTGLVDCGTWATSATFTTLGATSGVYLAKLTRIDAGIPATAASHIVFVVRDDSRHAKLLFQTSDTTWQAYNSYGGASLYAGGPIANPPVYGGGGRASKVSYNRPFNTRDAAPQSWLFNAEYPMLRWLERNGYDVSYFTGVDADRMGAEIANHKVFMSVGHDEYWSAAQRANVEAARDAGIHLAFFSGNEILWKTRWESSIDGHGTPYRTLVSYKETLAGAKIDPNPAWTGLWRDNSNPPADGGRPENALTGTIWTVNCCSSAITVPQEMGAHRFWRNTGISALQPGTVAALSANTLGYEWDEDLDNGARPSGLARLSSTTVDVDEKFAPTGYSIAKGTATHSLTLYRKDTPDPLGGFKKSIVFGAGTVQWSWGLDGVHDRGGSTPDARIQQATINLLADMGVQPATIQSGVTAGSASTDIDAPTSAIISPTGGSIESGGHLTISGTASDTGGGVVAGVEVSVDGGVTWHGATGRTTWTYDWSPGATGTATLMSRATDDSGNIGAPSTGVLVTVTGSNCPCSHLWNPATAVPAVPDASDVNAIEVGVRFSSDIDGYITGVRFYKSPMNNGTHVGNLWTAGGSLLASGTFTNESGSGWQELRFNSAVPVVANTSYVASYHTNVGHYSADAAYFATSGVNSAPLHAPASGAAGNGVFGYSASSTFPTSSFHAANYWVDVTFAQSIADDAPPSITEVKVSAVDGSTAVVSWKTNEEADSKVDYSTDSAFQLQTLSVENGAFVLDHSMTIAGLIPSNTYYFRITSKDHAGNPRLALTPGFTVPGPTLHDTAAVDFLAGTPGSTYVAQNADGEVTLAPARGSEFYGTTLPADWISVLWQPEIGGSVSVGGGVLAVDGARVGTCDGPPPNCEVGVYGSGHSLEFVATFTGDPFQHAGLASDVLSTPFALFSTKEGGSLFVRTNNGFSNLEEPLGTAWLGSAHRYRIDWTATGLNYSIDGVLVASHAAPIGTLMRPIAASDFKPSGGNIVVDWIRLLPYAPSGSFVSRVFDAGSAVDWATITWKGLTPAGTSIAIYERTGDTSTPGTGWTDFAPVAASGDYARHPHARYVQYRADLATSDPMITPQLQDVIISTAHAPVAVNDAATTPLNTAITFSANALNGNPLAVSSLVNTGSLMFNDTDVDTPNKVQFRTVAVTTPAHGTATLNTTGSVTYTPAAGYSGADSFTYAMSDGLLTSNYAIVTMTVGNRPPVATDDGTNTTPAYVLNEDGTLTVSAANRVTANDSDPDNDVLTAVLIGGATQGQVTLNADGSFVYTPNANFNGTDHFSYQVTDSSGQVSNPATVYIGVTAVNDAPSFTKGGDQSVLGAGARSIARWATGISAGPADEAGQTLNFLVTNSNTALFSVPPAVAADGTLTFTSVNVSGSATVTVQLHDNGGVLYNGVDTSAAQTFVINVTAVASPTTTTVTSSNSPSLFGVPITLTATVAAPGAGAPVGSVTFKDGAATIGSAALAGGVATMTTSTLAVGTHSITAVYAGAALFNASTSAAFSQVISPSATLKVAFKVHAMQDGTSKPKVTTIAVPNANVRVFATSNACTGGIFSTINAKKWGLIFDGADGPGGVDGCAPVSVGSYQATGVTDVNGNATIIVPPLNLSLSNQYLVIARATNFDYVKTAASPDPVYSQYPVLKVAAGQMANVPLAMIATFNGKIVPGAQAEFFGSYLDIVQPEYMDWTAEQEQYPFVMVAQGGWDVSTNIAPPSGFQTDATSIAATVADQTSAVQFTLTDVGSDWTETAVTHVINHLGTTRVQTSSVRMFNRRPTKAKPDFWAVTTNSGATEIPVLHNDVVAPPKTLTLTSATQPANGAVTLANGVLSYTPKANFTGLDTFTYTITDSVGVTSSADVKVKVGDKPMIFISDAAVNEGASGTMTPAVFTVTLSGALEIPVTFDYATRDLTAIAGAPGSADADYVAETGTLTFAPGETSKTITIEVIGDNFIELRETFAVDLLNVINAAVVGGRGTGAILNDDALPTISAADVSIVEGNAGTSIANVVVTVAGDFRDPITVDYGTVDLSAVAGSDYTAVSGTLTFVPGGALTQTIPIAIIGDTVREGNEAFAFRFANPINVNVVAGGARVTILEDDPLVISIADQSIVEGDAGTKNVMLTVKLSDRDPMPVTVKYATSNGTAVAGSDYVAASGTLTFDPGIVAQQIVVPIIGDTVAESSETFFVDLSSPVNGILGQSHATVTIANDDNSTWLTTTSADFNTGKLGAGTYIGLTADGELMLAPALGAEFSGSTLPAGWSIASMAGGSAAVANGAVVVNGAALLAPGTYSSGRTLEIGATFSGPNQSLGFGATAALVSPMAMFVTKADGLYAKTINGTKTLETLIPGSWLGAAHQYRIDWNAGNAQYLIDGTQLAAHTQMAWGTVVMKPVAADSTVGGAALTVDWVRMSPYAASASFVSRVFDAGSLVDWKRLVASVATPGVSTVSISYSIGNTPLPDATWTPFTAVTGNAGPLAGSARYVQFKIDMSQPTVGARSPVVSDVSVIYQKQ